MANTATLEVPPVFFHDDTFKHPASMVRRAFRALVGADGLVRPADYAVTPGTGQVQVGSGEAWVTGTNDPASQGVYLVRNSATKTLDIANRTVDRYDNVVLEILDNEYSGAGTVNLRVLTGTTLADPVYSGGGTIHRLWRIRVNASGSNPPVISSGDVTPLTRVAQLRVGYTIVPSATSHEVTAWNPSQVPQIRSGSVVVTSDPDAWYQITYTVPFSTGTSATVACNGDASSGTNYKSFVETAYQTKNGFQVRLEKNGQPFTSANFPGGTFRIDYIAVGW